MDATPRSPHEIGAELGVVGDCVVVLTAAEPLDDEFPGRSALVAWPSLATGAVVAPGREPRDVAVELVRTHRAAAADRSPSHGPGALTHLASGPRPHGGKELGSIHVFGLGSCPDPAPTTDPFAGRRAWPVLRRACARWGGTDAAQGGGDDSAAPTEFFEEIPGIRWVPLRSKTLPPATHTNCFVLGCGALTVVDPGGASPAARGRLRAALDALAAEGHRVVRVLLTHHHGDHVAGVKPLLGPGVELLGHRLISERLPGLRFDRLLIDGDRVGRGADAVEVVHTPGHVPEHIALRHLASGTWICADLMAAIGTIVVNPPDGSMTDYFASLQRLVDGNAGVTYPSHGPPIPDGRAHALTYLAHRRARERQIFGALADHGTATAAELVPEVYADVPVQFWPLAERNVVAHLEKLVDDGRAAREGVRWHVR